MQVFKWERRKGWDILLKAFLTEFTSKNNVALYLKTSPFHSNSNFAEQMQQWVEDHMLESEASLDKLPAVYVIDEQMTQDTLRSLYAAVDCFVLPSRCDCSRSTSLDSIGCGWYKAQHTQQTWLHNRPWSYTGHLCKVPFHGSAMQANAILAPLDGMVSSAGSAAEPSIAVD